jgi:hypothetical protein
MSEVLSQEICPSTLVVTVVVAVVVAVELGVVTMHSKKLPLSTASRTSARAAAFEPHSLGVL